MTELESTTLQVRMYQAGLRSWRSLSPAARRILMANRIKMIKEAWLGICLRRMGVN